MEGEEWKEEKAGFKMASFDASMVSRTLCSRLHLLYAPVHANRSAYDDTGVLYNHT